MAKQASSAHSTSATVKDQKRPDPRLIDCLNEADHKTISDFSEDLEALLGILSNSEKNGSLDMERHEVAALRRLARHIDSQWGHIMGFDRPYAQEPEGGAR